MGIDDQSTDLRLLSLLHALRDGEEFVREVRRLLKSPSMDELHWRNICDMGRELAPQNQLFDPGRSYRDHQIEAAEAESGDGRRIVYDRRQGERRVVLRRTNTNRRGGDRRTVELSWLGVQRRSGARRQYVRRQTDW